jgi:hypothetical protein
MKLGPEAGRTPIREIGFGECPAPNTFSYSGRIMALGFPLDIPQKTRPPITGFSNIFG